MNCHKSRSYRSNEKNRQQRDLSCKGILTPKSRPENWRPSACTLTKQASLELAVLAFSLFLVWRAHVRELGEQIGMGFQTVSLYLSIREH